jgi:hypothetical protein
VRESAPNVLQPAVIANGTMTSWITRLSDEHELVSVSLEAKSPEELVRRVYMRILTREPDASELKDGLEMISQGFDKRQITAVPVKTEKRKRPPFVTWSNHLDGPANALAAEIEEAARRGDPATPRLQAEWREQMEDLVWTVINKPEAIHIR